MNNTETYLLHDARRLQIKVAVFMINGFKLTGYISSFDENTIELVDEDGNRKLLYKHAISTINF